MRPEISFIAIGDGTGMLMDIISIMHCVLLEALLSEKNRRTVWELCIIDIILR